MPTLRLDTFGGIAPLIDPKKLPEWGAQAAFNCVFDGGDVRPLRLVESLAWGGAPPPTPPKRLYQWRNRWLTWSEDANVAASPVVGDQFSRIYWTRGGDERPRVATGDQLAGLVDATIAGTELGIFSPGAVPVVNTGGGEIPSVQAVEIAQTSPARVSTAVDHPFSNGQRVVVSLARAPGAPPDTPETPPDRTGMVEINGGEFVVKLVEGASGSGTDPRSFDLIGANAADYSDYDAERWVATITRIYTDADLDSRTYVFTWVSRYGEESQPSPPSEVVDVIRGNPVTVQITVGTAQIVQAYRIRLYRSVTGLSGQTGYFFVKEVGLSSVDVEIVDDVRDVALGELLPSETWSPPISGLRGMVAMPNGFFAAFRDNTLYFSEPYQPHAWPRQYTRPTQDEIVGLAVYGQTLVVATKGKPYIVTGTDPSSVSMSQLDLYAPALAKRAVVSTGTGVIYPTLDGLVHVSAAGPRYLTTSHFDKPQWEALVAAGVRDAAWHDGRYLLAAGNMVTIFEPVGEDRVNISQVELDVGVWGINTEVVSSSPAIPRDSLHFSPSTGLPALLFAFDRGGTRYFMGWASRTFVLPRPCAMACAQVFATSYPVTLTLHAARVQANGQPGRIDYPFADPQAQTIQVAGPEPFRLASGFMAREWRIDVSGVNAIQSVVVASSMDEIARE